MQKKKERAVEFGFCCKKSFKTQKGRSRHKKNIKTRCFMQDRKKTKMQMLHSISNLLQSMRLNYASLERIDTNMQFYPALIVCDLSHNRLTTLNPYGFEGQAQLNRLALGHNRIHTLYKESLNGLTNLQSLGEFSIIVLIEFYQQ